MSSFPTVGTDDIQTFSCCFRYNAPFAHSAKKSALRNEVPYATMLQSVCLLLAFHSQCVKYSQPSVRMAVKS